MIKIRLAHTSDAQLIALLGRITFIQSHSQYIKNDKDVKDFCDASFLVSKIKKELANENILFCFMTNFLWVLQKLFYIKKTNSLKQKTFVN